MQIKLSSRCPSQGRNLTRETYFALPAGDFLATWTPFKHFIGTIPIDDKDRNEQWEHVIAAGCETAEFQSFFSEDDFLDFLRCEASPWETRFTMIYDFHHNRYTL